MSSSPQTTSTPPPAAVNTIPPFPYRDLLRGGPFGDWRDDYERYGYVVIPAIPRERALQYRDRAFAWLESLGYGFKRDDLSTYTQAHLPMYQRGGMYGGNAYGFGQSQLLWDLRTEPGVLSAFEKLWGTSELVVSFDGGSLMLPRQAAKEGEASSWQHIDQSPSRVGFFVAQGLVNLNDNDAEDGGLLVMKGSSRLMSKFFDIHGRPSVPAERIDWHKFSDEDKQWFVDQGCEWIKVDAAPGDLILWDSSTMHQNRPPSGQRDRMVTYICMGPADLLTEKDKEVRKTAFAGGRGSSHTPFHGFYSFPYPDVSPIRPESGKPDDKYRVAFDPRKETEQVLKLAGVTPY